MLAIHVLLSILIHEHFWIGSPKALLRTMLCYDLSHRIIIIMNNCVWIHFNRYFIRLNLGIPEKKNEKSKKKKKWNRKKPTQWLLFGASSHWPFEMSTHTSRPYDLYSYVSLGNRDFYFSFGCLAAMDWPYTNATYVQRCQWLNSIFFSGAHSSTYTHYARIKFWARVGKTIGSHLSSKWKKINRWKRMKWGDASTSSLAVVIVVIFTLSYCMCEKLLHTADAFQFDRWNGSSDNSVSMHFINFFVFTMSHKQLTHTLKLLGHMDADDCMGTLYAGRQAHFKK